MALAVRAAAAQLIFSSYGPARPGAAAEARAARAYAMDRRASGAARRMLAGRINPNRDRALVRRASNARNVAIPMDDDPTR
jgi:hypothetical protein